MLKVLRTAAEQGDIKVIEYCLKEKKLELVWRRMIACIGIEQNNINVLDLMVKNDPGMVDYLLKHAAGYGALNAVHHLVETQNSSILVRDAFRILGVVVEKGHLNILKYFIDVRNISIDISTDGGSQRPRRRPLLFRAVQLQHYDIVDYLIEEKKANLTLLDFEGQNILYAATQNCDLEFIKYVLDEKKANIDVNQKNKHGKTLLLKAACWWNCSEVLEYLVEQKHVNVHDAYDRAVGSPLHCVQSAKICAFLLERGVDSKGRDEHGNTPLHQVICAMATDDKHMEEYKRVYDSLIRHGADVNSRNNYGESPLDYSSRQNLLFWCRTRSSLSNRGANMQWANGYRGRRPLRGSIEPYHVECVESASTSSKPKFVSHPQKATSGKKKSFSCPECGAKFVRAKRSGTIPYSILTPSTDVHGRQLRISSDHSPDVNLSSSSSGLQLSYLPGFLTIAQLLMKNGNTSSIHASVTDDRSLWSPKMILANRMDPLAEDVINEIQF